MKHHHTHADSVAKFQVSTDAEKKNTASRIRANNDAGHFKRRRLLNTNYHVGSVLLLKLQRGQFQET